MPRRSQLRQRASVSLTQPSPTPLPPTTTINGHDASNSLQLLADAALAREQALNEYEPEPIRSDTDDENDSDAPIFDVFYERGGSKSISDMTNFDPSQFHSIWNELSEFILSNYNIGPGKKSKQTPKDVLFMMLTTQKHAGQWEFLGRLFGFKGPTFERLIMRFVTMLSNELYESLVARNLSVFDMDQMLKEESHFEHFRYARYAVDVTFQQGYRPSGSLQEGKVYYSGKHKLYGYKVEVSVLPNGMAINCTKHYPGSYSDLDIFTKNRAFHKKALAKRGEDTSFTDIGLLIDQYPRSWAALMDKGYQSAAEIIRAISPKKKPANRMLSTSDEAFNRKVASDRIIVENYFGRLSGLWGVIAGKWKWKEDNYDMVFRLCIALSNVHIRWHPLRASDKELYHRMKNRIYQMGEEIEARKRRIQRNYRERRRRRMDLQFGPVCIQKDSQIVSKE